MTGSESSRQTVIGNSIIHRPISPSPFPSKQGNCWNAFSGVIRCFQWSDSDYDLGHVKEELADVLVYCRNLLDELGVDEDEIVNAKMAQNEAKYPVEKARGSAAKYDQL